jgi:hypothetical protein
MSRGNANAAFPRHSANFALSSPILESVAGRNCTVSFTDSEGVTHSAEVAASSLFEACALGMAALRKAGIDPVTVGDHARLTVTVQSPTMRHEVIAKRVSAWLQSSGKSPREQALKSRLRTIVDST